MDLNDIVFQMTRASIALSMMLSSGDIEGAKEQAAIIAELIVPLGEASCSITEILDQRNERVTAHKKIKDSY